MKKFILMVLVASATAIYQPAKAQVSLNVNIGLQPNWGPRGYDHVDYYYLPETESYYHVPTKRFIYMERNRWVQRKALPSKYRHYNLHTGRKIVINQPRPYLQHHIYQSNYSRPAGSGYVIREKDHRKGNHFKKHDNRGRNDRGRNDHGRRH